jgi:2-(1,2-epoxy-1,2-dihydrophenyl)acetyl-CoA isomerase
MHSSREPFINATATVRVDWPTPEHACLLITRAAQHNALGLDELAGLADAASHLSQARPRVLSIMADGPNFGVGGDITAFAQAISDNQIEQWLRTAIGYYNRAISQLRALDAAVVVGVQGATAGGTLGLIWCADHVILADNVAINMAYAKLGGSPDGGTSWLLPQLVNPLRAFEMFTLKSSLAAPQALDWGLANQVVPVAQLESSVASVTTKWLSLPSMSLRNIKQLLRAAPTQDMQAHMTQEVEGFVRASQQPEFVQRVQKFFAGS